MCDGNVRAQAEQTEGQVTEQVVQEHEGEAFHNPIEIPLPGTLRPSSLQGRGLCINRCSLKANNFCFPYKKQNSFQKYPCAWTLPRVQRYLLIFRPDPLWQSGEFYEPPFSE